MTPPTVPTWGHALTAAVWLLVVFLFVAMTWRTCGPRSADVERQWAESVRRATAEDGGE
jgi:hypothetical protein